MFPPLPVEPAKTHALNLIKELEINKELQSCETGFMFGVLVCRKSPSAGCSDEVVLKAFSGQFLGRWQMEGWVPPLLDVAEYDKQVAKDNDAIHSLTEEILSLEKTLEGGSQNGTGAGNLFDSQKVDRLKKLRLLRKNLSSQSLVAIYNLYRFPCADGVTRTFADFYPDYNQGSLPPTGTGDCCGPKLFGAAFSQGLIPLSLAEFYYEGKGGRLNSRENQLGRRHREFYPPCDEKCGLVLPVMLGLEILYQDESIVVVNKPAGLLSVPGRGPENQDCVVTRLQRLFPHSIAQPSVHRLDQDTSGLLVLALTQEAHRHLSRQFMDGSVYKEYQALLRGRVVEKKERAFVNNSLDILPPDLNYIELPFRLDIENRPRQIYDEVHGKTGITLWKVLSYHRCEPHVCSQKVLTRVLFVPKTGRTHQLRLHAMHEKGLGVPIQGDRLYGERLPGERLMLHASLLRFTHPQTKKSVEFVSLAPF